MTLLLASCSEPCGGNEADGGDAPRIADMSIVHDARKSDPWEVVFVTKFESPSGRLGEGTASFYVGNNQPATLGLQDAFRAVGLPLDATSGTLATPLRFQDTVPDGASVRVSTQLEDGAGQHSNCYSLSLDFDVH